MLRERDGARKGIAALVFGAALCASACGGTQSKHATTTTNASEGIAERAVVTIRTVGVVDPGNRAVAIVPFHPGIYQSCSEAPSRRAGCQLVGSVDYTYEIGELEITVGQYVAFLNTVDPSGSNARGLYVDSMSPSSWPKYGSIRYSTGSSVAVGHHYSVAYPQWANKPVGFANFRRAASFANALTNGEVLSRAASTSDGFDIVTYKVRLSPESEKGMYDLPAHAKGGATRTRSVGFVVPSQDEWIKAAYYDSKGGGTFSYWEFPTGPSKAPSPSRLNSQGDVVNAADQPLSTYSARTAAGAPSVPVPSWCPMQAGSGCESVNPLGLSADEYQSQYKANLSTVGQTGTRSPWGTLDQGGNVVEWTDTVAPSPLGSKDPRVWRRAHGGVANAPAYQLWISAIGRVPEGAAVIGRVNPWSGFRMGVIGKLGTK